MYAVLMHYGRSSLLNSSYEWQERNLIWDQTGHNASGASPLWRGNTVTPRERRGAAASGFTVQLAGSAGWLAGSGAGAEDETLAHRL